MDMRIERHLELAIGRGGVIRRRDFLRGLSAAALAAGSLTWRDALATEADELRRQGKACILLWMQGGPSQFETFSPKPDHANGGATKAIKTTVPGIEVSENFPRVAEQAKHLAIIRSMTSKEGSHPRASYLLHTGYLPTASVKYPAFGSIAAKELEQANFDLPSFVRIGNAQNSAGGGLLGSHYDPFVMPQAGKVPVNTKPMIADERFDRRLDLLSRLESDYAAQAPAEVADHQKLYGQAQRMIHSPKMAAFDLSTEPQTVRDAYGNSPFALGCLLSRRLVETGVPFVEVVADGWDTHFDNFDITKKLATTVDQPFAALLADLETRGMLDKTLVIWMGEFGRTPRINARDGRDHYPKAFNVVLAGGGVRGGQVIGETDAGGAEVSDRPVRVPDLFASFCHSLSIDAAKENMSSIGRPIKLVDGGQVVKELFV
ncbi:MAG TPA: DUF1501 domain-containing protein [Pirellulales bacterium]|jgi:uncharacterized protein (DUF1501 family)|nr:DUF1501 domain-containing protein [Pirellulales bacterium]